MNFKNLLLLALLAVVLLTQCKKNDDELKAVNFATIGQGDIYRYTNAFAEGGHVYTNQSDWLAFVNQLDTIESIYRDIANFNIDFNTKMLILQIDKVYGNGGHSIDIIKLEENESQVFVTTDRLKKGNITSVVTQPYHLVMIDKKDKTVVFK